MSGDLTGIDLQLVLGGAVTGKVIVPTGYSTAGMRVYAGQLARWADVAADGTYRIGSMSPGTHVAWLDRPDSSDLYSPADQTYSITPGVTTTGVDFVTVVGASISGVVTQTGIGPPSPTVVYALQAGSGVVIKSSTTDGSGHYALRGLKPGAYFIEFDNYWTVGALYPVGAATDPAAAIQVTDGMNVTVNQTLLDRSAIQGHLRDLAGAGVAGVTVSLEPVSGDAPFDVATTDADGYYRTWDSYPGLTPGSFRVRFTVPAGANVRSTYYGGGTRESATIVTLDVPGALLDVSTVFQASGRYVPKPPTRVYDSRTAAAGPLRAGEYRTIDLDPGDTHAMTAAVLNVTTTRTTCRTTYVSAGASLRTDEAPTTSVVNARAGADVANLVTVRVGLGGQLTLYSNSCATDVVVDLEGYYSDSGGAGYVPATTPTRVLDTRMTSAGIGPHQTRRVDLKGAVPANAVAAVVTLTSTRATAASTYVSAFPTGSPDGPTTSVVNAIAGADIANTAPVQLAPDGSISIYNNAGQVDVVVDVVGWYTSDGGAAFWSTTPTRAVSSGPFAGGQTLFFSQRGGGTVPDDAVALALNITTTHLSVPTSYLVAYPGYSTPRPATSNGNARAGIDVANGTLVALGEGGYSVYNNAGQVDVLEDVFGYFAPTS